MPAFVHAVQQPLDACFQKELQITKHGGAAHAAGLRDLPGIEGVLGHQSDHQKALALPGLRMGFPGALQLGGFFFADFGERSCHAHYLTCFTFQSMRELV